LQQWGHLEHTQASISPSWSGPEKWHSHQALLFLFLTEPTVDTDDLRRTNNMCSHPHHSTHCCTKLNIFPFGLSSLHIVGLPQHHHHKWCNIHFQTDEACKESEWIKVKICSSICSLLHQGKRANCHCIWQHVIIEGRLHVSLVTNPVHIKDESYDRTY
jgi:hypothetical protein